MSLRGWRLRQRMTQEALGRNIGVCRRTVINNERGRPTDKYIGALLRKYPEAVTEITGESDVPITTGRSTRSLDDDL